MRNPAAIIICVVLSILSFAQADKPQNSPQTAKSGIEAADPGLSAAANAAMLSIDKEKIREHVKYLASDQLEGRGTGQKGGDLAAEYIAGQFASYGLKPAGAKGSYLQPVPLVGVTTLPETKFTLVPEHGGAMELKYRDDYVVNNLTLEPAVTIDAPIVYVGYGIEAPEYKWDDYKNVDVRGKVLLMLVNEPPSDDAKFFTGKALTYYGRWMYKYEEAARKGAVGAILIHKTDMASYGWDVVRNSNAPEKANLRDGKPKLKAASWVQLEVAQKLLAAEGKSLDELMKAAQSRDFHPLPLAARLRAHVVSRIRDMHSANVIAMLPGSDPKLRDQAVIFSAHYDHLGKDPTVQGDNIYNGAADNATGCGVLLEIARAYAGLPEAQRPKRSIIFASVTAEEQGLLGSQYLGQNPPLPARNISLGLNFDDIDPIGDPQEVEVSGAERETVYPVVEQTAKTFGLTIMPDARPEAGHYYRSDHFSFARVGIPAFSIGQGMKFAGHAEEWGKQQAEDYTANRYHQPTDEYKPEMDFTGNAKMARFGFELGWKAANAAELVQWKAGDEFEAARKR